MSGVKCLSESPTSITSDNCWAHSWMVAPGRNPETASTLRTPVFRVVNSSNSDLAS